jgi:hypothetical protein
MTFASLPFLSPPNQNLLVRYILLPTDEKNGLEDLVLQPPTGTYIPGVFRKPAAKPAGQKFLQTLFIQLKHWSL